MRALVCALVRARARVPVVMHVNYPRLVLKSPRHDMGVVPRPIASCRAVPWHAAPCAGRRTVLVPAPVPPVPCAQYACAMPCPRAKTSRVHLMSAPAPVPALRAQTCMHDSWGCNSTLPGPTFFDRVDDEPETRQVLDDSIQALRFATARPPSQANLSMCVDVHTEMCIGLCVDILRSTYRHLHRHAYRHTYRHKPW